MQIEPIEIEWGSFLLVFATALIAAGFLVFFYALGLRMLVRAGKVPMVPPTDFTGQLATMTKKQAEKATKKAKKADRKSPLTEGQKNLAKYVAYACFVVVGIVIITGIIMIVRG